MGLSYNPSSVSDGIVLYLDAANPRSYAGTGTTWYDISGNSNNATFVDSPTYLSVPQPYFNFDGVNDYMRIVRSPSMSPTSGLTQEVWFNYTSIPATTIFIGLQYGAFTNNTYALFKDANLIYGGVNTSGSFNAIGTGTTNLVGNRWYHFVHTYDGSTQKLYLDGVLMTTGSQSGTIQYDVNNTRVLIGADDNSGYNSGASYPHPGKMGQVRIYNRGLSAAEVLKNYNAQRKRYFQEDNIVTNGLTINLDAGNSSSYAGTGTSWYDTSGNNYSGTITNGPAFSGQNGGMITFDGTNDHIVIPGFSITGSFTIEVWCFTTSLSGVIVVGKYGGGSYDFWVGVFSSIFKFSISISGSKAEPYTATISANTWYHVTAVYNATALTASIYLNGTLSQTVSGTFAFQNPPGNYAVGAFGQNGGYYWPGNIPIHRYYNRVLTSAEILQNYNATKGRFGL
jgi:hypothetical protein